MHKSENHYLIGDKIQVTFILQYMEFYLFRPFSHNQSLQEKSLGKEYFPIYSSGNHFSGIEKAVPYGPHFPQSKMFCIALLSVILLLVIAYQFHLSCQVIFMVSTIYMSGATFQRKASALNTLYRTRIYLNTM